MKSLILVGLLSSFTAQATRLSEIRPFEYEVLFTNPECKTYYYERPLVTNTGNEVRSKTRNAYCKSSDASRSQNRADSPHSRFIDWISDKNTKSIFMSYLSFSKSSITKELCYAIKRGVSLTMIIDSNNDGDENRMREFNNIEKCALGANNVRLELRGGEGRGGNKLGYAHNKIFLVNFDRQGETKVAFSSGNLSSGLATHHENWHFITTHSSSYFAQAHLCLMNGMLDHARGKKEYADYVAACKNKIQAEAEEDIQTYFVPGEGKQALSAMAKEFKNADKVMVAAHRFSLNSLNSMISDALSRNKIVQLVADDDLHYSSVYRRGIGRNMTQEAYKVKTLERQGLEAKFIETWMDDLEVPTTIQLHHNKFLIFKKGNQVNAVFAGAGNLTDAAFLTNFENFYMIRIPSVVEKFDSQYDYLFNKLGKSSEELPNTLELP